jgi:DNA invertase Pin-like site-specific DNA recombinase
MTTPAIGYLRASGPEVFTITQSQRDAINAWSQRTDHLVVGWVEDILVFGTESGTGLAEVVQRVAAGEAAVVAVQGRTRISRMPAVVADWERQITAAGGELIETGP